MIDEAGEVILEVEPMEVTTQELCLWSEQHFWQPSCFISRGAWDACGPLEESLTYAMDLDLWFKIARRFRFATTSQSLLQA